MTGMANSALESIIDAGSLSQTLKAIANICDEKAIHIYESYNDKPLSDRWAKRATEIRKLAAKY